MVRRPRYASCRDLCCPPIAGWSWALTRPRKACFVRLRKNVQRDARSGRSTRHSSTAALTPNIASFRGPYSIRMSFALSSVSELTRPSLSHPSPQATACWGLAGPSASCQISLSPLEIVDHHHIGAELNGFRKQKCGSIWGNCQALVLESIDWR